MTSTTAPKTPESRARASAIGWASDPQGPARRKRGRIAAAVVLMVVCGWLGAVVFLSVGHRREVVALARPVARFTQLSRSDMRVVQVASDPSVSVVSATHVDDMVGRVAATDLTPGSLLSDKQLMARGRRPVGNGEAVVGTLLASTDSPDVLPLGTRVQVIVRAAASDSANTDSQTIRGWILAVGNADQASGEGRKVSLVVPADDAGKVSAAASEKRVSVVVLGGS